MDFSSLNPTTTNALNLAARNNAANTVKRLLKKMNPNCIDNRGWTCLHEAAYNDSYESMLLILEHKDCRPLVETHEGHTALYLACKERNSLRTIEALLKHKRDIANYGSMEGITPLHLASAEGRIDLMVLLINYGAMISIQDSDGDTPLHDAVMSYQHASIDVLLYHDIDTQIRNESDYTAFDLACYLGCMVTFHKLYPYVIDVNEATSAGETPLLLAAKGSNVEIILFLLKEGADPHLKNTDGEMAIDIALHLGYSGPFKVLLNAMDKDKINRNIVLRACNLTYFKVDILEALLRHYLGPEFFDFNETFHVTCEKIGGLQPVYYKSAPLNAYLHICNYIFKHVSVDKFWLFFILFLINGADVNTINKEECPPLVYIHYCLHITCFVKVLSLLTEFDCNVDYCTVSKPGAECSLPDAFIVSLSSDPSTAPYMLQYSLMCEPLYLLKFAAENGLLDRIPCYVQKELLFMEDASLVDVSVDLIPYTVLPLKQLSRQAIRRGLRGRRPSTTKQFLQNLTTLPIPPSLKEYLRYTHVVLRNSLDPA